MILFRKWAASFLLLLLVWSCSGEDKRRGDELFQQGQYQEAVEAYSERLSLDPSNVHVLYGRARAKEELGNLEGAIEDYKTALTYDDRNVRVLLGLGDVYYKQKDFDNALYYYEQATNFEQNNANALFKEGKAHHKLGNVEEASDLYDAALREDPRLGDAYYYRGALAVSQKNMASACNDFKKAQELGVQEAAEAIAKYCR